MNKYISLILSAAVIFGSAESNANTDKCKESLVKVTTELLYTEGFNQINTCSGAGTSDNCQLDFYGCYAPDTRSSITCSLRYTYGGAYYNYNDCVFIVDSTCQIQSLSIERL